jgi:hypothetical protein
VAVWTRYYGEKRRLKAKSPWDSFRIRRTIERRLIPPFGCLDWALARIMRSMTRACREPASQPPPLLGPSYDSYSTCRLRRSAHNDQQTTFLDSGNFVRELKGGYSITSSARASSDGGTRRPSALAVLRLIASSYLVGACTGRSAGFSPLRMRST